MADFLLEVEGNCLALERELLCGSYRPGAYRTFCIRAQAAGYLGGAVSRPGGAPRPVRRAGAGPGARRGPRELRLPPGKGDPGRPAPRPGYGAPLPLYAEARGIPTTLELDALRTTVGIRIYPDTPLALRALEEWVIAPGDDLLRPRFYLAPGLEPWIYERVTPGFRTC